MINITFLLNLTHPYSANSVIGSCKMCLIETHSSHLQNPLSLFQMTDTRIFGHQSIEAVAPSTVVII